MIVLASDFSGLAPFIVLVPFAGILGAVSFFPAWRGHWAAPVLVTPLLIVGVLAAVGMVSNASLVTLATGLLLMSPLVVALTSIGLWATRMRVRSRARSAA